MCYTVFLNFIKITRSGLFLRRKKRAGKAPIFHVTPALCGGPDARAEAGMTNPG